jgi:hypothetical protein
VKLQQLLPLHRKNSFPKKTAFEFELCEFELVLRPGHLNLFVKIQWKLICPSCSTNSANWRRTEFVHVDMCILLKLIKVYRWKRIKPTTGFEFVFATCHSILPGTCVEWWPTWSCHHAQDIFFETNFAKIICVVWARFCVVWTQLCVVSAQCGAAKSVFMIDHEAGKSRDLIGLEW